MVHEIFGAEDIMQRILCRYSRTKQKIIAEYIKNQLEEDYAQDQISMKKYIDPFTGNKNK